MSRRWTPLSFTLHRTAGISLMGGNAYSLMSGQVWANASRPRGAGELRENESGHWHDSFDAKRSILLCQTIPKSGLTFGGSRSTPPTWASVSTESRLRGSRLLGREPLSRRGTCPESKGGYDVHVLFRVHDCEPPWRFIWDTTAMLSILTITWHPLSEGRKWISARKTALSSRKFMYKERNTPVQTLHAGLPSKTMPKTLHADLPSKTPTKPVSGQTEVYSPTELCGEPKAV